MTWVDQGRRRKYQREYQAAWRASNPERDRAIASRSYKKHIEKRRAEKREYQFVKSYGIGSAEKSAILEKQGGVCAACGTDDPGSKRGWSLDHCHTTQQIRGVLCRRCNVTLGHVKDCPDRLRSLIRYLEASRPRP